MQTVYLTLYYRMANILPYKRSHNSFFLGATKLKLLPNYSSNEVYRPIGRSMGKIWHLAI